MQRVFDFLRTDDLPLLARPNYCVELQHMVLWAVVFGAVEGNIASIVVSNTFKGSYLLTTLVWAIPLLANVLNVVWGIILRGRRRRPTFVVLAGCVLASTCSIALTPSSWQPWGGWIFAGQLAVTHLFISGLITLRTSIWQVNYPRGQRAQITGRLQTLRFMMALATGASLTALFDRHAQYYHYVYPAVVGVGLLSLIPIRRLRIRGEKLELRRLREHLNREDNHANGDPRSLGSGLREAAAILRNDRPFARYMLGQFLLGSANFMVDPVLIAILTKQLFVERYFIPNLLMFQVPVILILITIRFWARFFDRVGVLRFRIYNSGFWLGAHACVALSMFLITVNGTAILWIAIPLLACGRVFNGIARGGGAIGWHLGHLHFAGEHQENLYLGIHIGLTGLRGLIMPIVGLTVHHFIGWGSFVVAGLLALTSHIMFRRLYHVDQRAALAREAHAQELKTAAARTDVT